jgi:hypothetical protein
LRPRPSLKPTFRDSRSHRCRPARRAGSPATGLALGLVAAGTVATLAVSLSVASVWTRAVSYNAPTSMHASTRAAPLVSALGEWHRTMIRAAAHSGPASGFGTALDIEPQETDLAPLVAPAAPAAAVKPTARPPVVMRKPVMAPAPKVEKPHTLPAPPSVTKPRAEAEPVPLPLKRPHIAEAEPPEKPATLARAMPEPAPEPKAPAKPAPEPKVAALPPPATEPKAPAVAIDRRTAVYDIEGHTVYLPNGRRLEAHSGLGRMRDDPDYSRVKMRGPTPPNVYALSMRESLFHGVRAIRLTPVDEKKMFGRDGMLAHTYMLGPNGQSNGCVSFRNYNAFLQAFLDGEVNRMVVVPKLDAKTRAALALPAPKWGLFSAFAE